jgi:hypothetical protein
LIKYCKYIKKKIDFLFEKRKNFLFNPINIIKKNAEALLDSSKENSLEVNTETTKYWVEQKFLRISNEKSIFFLNICKIFNQLYNFHCLHYLCNGKTNIKMA